MHKIRLDLLYWIFPFAHPPGFASVKWIPFLRTMRIFSECIFILRKIRKRKIGKVKNTSRLLFFFFSSFPPLRQLHPTPIRIVSYFIGRLIADPGIGRVGNGNEIPFWDSPPFSDGNRALFPLCYAGNWITLKSSILNLRLTQAGHSKFRYVDVVAVKSQ